MRVLAVLQKERETCRRGHVLDDFEADVKARGYHNRGRERLDAFMCEVRDQYTILSDSLRAQTHMLDSSHAKAHLPSSQDMQVFLGRAKNFKGGACYNFNMPGGCNHYNCKWDHRTVSGPELERLNLIVKGGRSSSSPDGAPKSAASGPKKVLKVTLGQQALGPGQATTDTAQRYVLFNGQFVPVN